MNNGEKCTGCPGDVMYQQSLTLLEAIRDGVAQEAEHLLDDEVAQYVATTLHQAGVIDDPTDLQAVRNMPNTTFELFELLEKLLLEKREAETRFCVGALRLRAKDSRTEYNVALCRSPQSQSGTTAPDVEMAVVKKRSLPSAN